MVKHGLLSPRSKLLPQAEAGSVTSSCIDGRPCSTSSMGTYMMQEGSSSFGLISGRLGSTATKAGIMKDKRDTPMRKERHRDGRLLRGGIGLTTGLGWSDRYVD